MRAVDIRVSRVFYGAALIKACFRKNWKFYLQEALGLGIFMASACFFSGIFFGEHGRFSTSLPWSLQQGILGIMMGLTALLIFYSPVTSPSGSHINPAVTLAFYRLGKISFWDSFFYILFQFTGGTSTVYLMERLMGKNLSAAPLHDVVTVPGRFGTAAAAITEFIIAWIMMAMILFTSDHRILKKYTRVFAGILVSIFVIVAGPVSGFGMNPARSFASALPARVWTAFWIYLIIPIMGMLAAVEFYLLNRRKK